VFGEALNKTHADALRIWNMDESGISNVHKPVNIVAKKVHDQSVKSPAARRVRQYQLSVP